MCQDELRSAPFVSQELIKLYHDAGTGLYFLVDERTREEVQIMAPPAGEAWWLEHTEADSLAALVSQLPSSSMPFSSCSWYSLECQHRPAFGSRRTSARSVGRATAMSAVAFFEGAPHIH